MYCGLSASDERLLHTSAPPNASHEHSNESAVELTRLDGALTAAAAEAGRAPAARSVRPRSSISRSHMMMSGARSAASTNSYGSNHEIATILDTHSRPASTSASPAPGAGSADSHGGGPCVAASLAARRRGVC